MPPHGFSLIPEKVSRVLREALRDSKGSRLLQVIDFILRQLIIHHAFVDAADRVEADNRTCDLALSPCESDLGIN